MSIIIANLLSDDAGDLGVLSSAGSATATGALAQGHALAVSSDGAGATTIAFVQVNYFKELVALGDALVPNLVLSHARDLGSLTADGVGTGEDMFLRNGNEPNRFIVISSAGVADTDIDTKRELTTVLTSPATSSVSISLTANPAPYGELAIFLDLIPAQPASLQHLDARLLVNNVEVPVKAFRYSAPASGTGDVIELDLSKPDLTQIDEAGTWEFQIGTKTAGNGSVTWHTILDGVFGAQNYAISFSEDSLRISAVASFADRLDQTPRAGFILYDPALAGSITLDSTDLLRDTLGNTYGFTLEAVSDLRLRDVLERAFVTEAGFTAVRTNIPDFPVARVDFSSLTTYRDAVSGLLGPFEPVFFDLAGELWVIDVTAGLPSAFTPRALAPARYTSFDANSAKERLDGLVIRFTEPNDYDLGFTVTTETDEAETGSGDDYQRTVSTRTIREYARTETPDVIEKRIVTREVIATYDDSNTLIAETTADFVLDGFGNVTQQRTKKRALVPALSAPYSVTLDEIRDETVTYSYRYAGRRPTLYRRVTQITGLIAVDADNTYLDEPFKQEFGDAHRAGNLAEGMTTETGPIKTVVETFEPVGNGQTKVVNHTIDFLRRTSLRSETETFAGQADQTPQRSRSLLVWRDGIDLNDTIGKRVGDLAVGPLPLRYAVPLARRRLARANSAKGEASARFLGFDLAVRRGALFRIYGRSGANLGDHLVAGYTIEGRNLGLSDAVIETGLQMLEL